MRDVVVSAMIFTLIFAVYASSRVITSSDSRWTLHVAMSIIKEGNVDLDEYGEIIEKNQHAAIMYLDDHLYYFFPSGTPVLITPIVLLIDKVAHHFWSVDLYARLQEARDALVRGIELYIACFLVALVCVLIYLIARQSLDRKRSMLLTLLFAFCTSAWSTASRALWSHGPSMLMLSASLYLLLRARTRPSLAQYVSIPLACAYIIRPTNSISVVLLTVYILVKYPRYLLRYLCYAAILALPFIAHNYQVYHQPLPPYHVPERLRSTHFAEALIAHLVSPARGLLIYSPILLFAAYGVALKIRRSEFELLDGLLLGAVFLHWLVISTLWQWWGGGSYGPRLFTDMLPYLIYFLIPVLREMTRPTTLRGALTIALFSILAAISLFIHFRGGTDDATRRWNLAAEPVVANVDDDPSRVWDWSDPQFWRGLRPARFSVATQALCLDTRTTTPDDLSLTIINAGDRPFTCQIRSPKELGLGFVPATMPGPRSYDLTIILNPAKYAPGVHSLGGIYIDALSADGQSIDGCPIVVPVGLQVPPSPHDESSDSQRTQPATETPLSPAPSECAPAVLDAYVPPKDILVNGQPQATTPGQFRAVHGAGWWPIEGSSDRKWRWAESPAEVYVYSPEVQDVSMLSTPTGLHEKGEPQGVGQQGTLLVTTNGQLDASFQVHAKEPFAVETTLQTGWNVIRMELEAGNFRPVEVNPSSKDRRSLSFALDELDIILK